MMKEWKNNPESDEESITDIKSESSIEEKLKSYQLKENDPNIISPTNEEEDNQVGRVFFHFSKGKIIYILNILGGILSFLMLVCIEEFVW